MSDDKSRGLYGKYYVERNDPTGRHKNCFYFVLDTVHDKHALPALRAYRDSCMTEYPVLARDLDAVIRTMEPRFAREEEAKPDSTL